MEEEDRSPGCSSDTIQWRYVFFGLMFSLFAQIGKGAEEG